MMRRELRGPFLWRLTAVAALAVSLVLAIKHGSPLVIAIVCLLLGWSFAMLGLMVWVLARGQDASDPKWWTRLRDRSVKRRI